MRLPEVTLFPAALHQGRHGDSDYVEAAAYVTGVELRRLGVNMNLAPLLDLYDQNDGTVINGRAYGAESGLIADYARAYVRGANRAGIVSVAKHFPGHGVTTNDSHDRLPVVRLTRSERSAILGPLRAIDTGSTRSWRAYPVEDLPELPASVSPQSSPACCARSSLDGVVIPCVEIRVRRRADGRPTSAHSFTAGSTSSWRPVVTAPAHRGGVAWSVPHRGAKSAMDDSVRRNRASSCRSR